VRQEAQGDPPRRGRAELGREPGQAPEEVVDPGHDRRGLGAQGLPGHPDDARVARARAGGWGPTEQVIVDPGGGHGEQLQVAEPGDHSPDHVPAATLELAVRVVDEQAGRRRHLQGDRGRRAAATAQADPQDTRAGAPGHGDLSPGGEAPLPGRRQAPLSSGTGRQAHAPSSCRGLTTLEHTTARPRSSIHGPATGRVASGRERDGGRAGGGGAVAGGATRPARAAP